MRSTRLSLGLLLAFAAAPVAIAGAQSTCANGAGSVPSGWTLFGPGGGATQAATSIDGPLPLGASTFCWLATETGASGLSTVVVPNGLSSSTRGAYAVSPTFSGAAGDQITFYFNFLTTDGTGNFADWARARLLNAVGGSQAALIFTAQTGNGDQVVPAFGFQSPDATFSPGTASLQGNVVTLNGQTYGPGRYGGGVGGSSGWVQAAYTLQGAGSYQLEFSTSDMSDTSYPTAMAFLGTSIVHSETNGGGTELIGGTTTPEPASLTLIGTGLVGLVGFVRRRRNSAQA